MLEILFLSVTIESMLYHCCLPILYSEALSRVIFELFLENSFHCKAVSNLLFYASLVYGCLSLSLFDSMLAVAFDPLCYFQLLSCYVAKLSKTQA